MQKHSFISNLNIATLTNIADTTVTVGFVCDANGINDNEQFELPKCKRK